MIAYFNIPAQASAETTVSKKLFAEKMALSPAEKRLLRDDVERIVMRGLLQTRTTGIASFVDGEFCYDQIVFAEVSLKRSTHVAAVAGMVQKAFPVPLFLILNEGRQYGVNWCVKRINQADKSKRVIEELHTTRFFTLDAGDALVGPWLRSLDVGRIACRSLKELFDELACRLMMLSVSDEAGVFVQADYERSPQYRFLLGQLAANREEQAKVVAALKAETQFNAQLRLNARLKELQLQEKEWKNKITLL